MLHTTPLTPYTYRCSIVALTCDELQLETWNLKLDFHKYKYKYSMQHLLGQPEFPANGKWFVRMRCSAWSWSIQFCDHDTF